jgi:hypothetical protein
VSARDWRAVREGETHAATRTSTNNTPESFIVGVGASGALLAGAAIVFVTLVGLVSFNVWPTGPAVTADRNVELSAATPNTSQTTTTTPVSAAAGQVASTTAGGAGAGGGNVGGDNSQGGGGGQGGGKGGNPKSGTTSPPIATTTPAPTDGSNRTDDSGSQSPPGSASKSPTHPVHPVHPDTSHGNVSDGTNGKEDPSTGDDSGDVITGKGPFTKPNRSNSSSDSSSSSSTSTTSENGQGLGHGSSRSNH